jgi:hypothetical protein
MLDIVPVPAVQALTLRGAVGLDGALRSFELRSRSIPDVNVAGWPRGLEVTCGGQGVVSHAGLTLLRQLADNAG